MCEPLLAPFPKAKRTACFPQAKLASLAEASRRNPFVGEPYVVAAQLLAQRGARVDT